MDYTTIDAVKEFLAIESDTDDAVLKRLITGVSSAMDAIMSRSLPLASYTDIFDGAPAGDAWGSTHLVPTHDPVASVSAVVIDGLALPESDGRSAGWLLVDGVVELIGFSTSAGKGNVSISYTAGYATIPPAIENACIQLVAQRFKERARIGVSSENNGAGMSRSYDFDLPPWVEKILNQFANVVPR